MRSLTIVTLLPATCAARARARAHDACAYYRAFPGSALCCACSYRTFGSSSLPPGAHGHVAYPPRCGLPAALFSMLTWRFTRALPCRSHFAFLQCGLSTRCLPYYPPKVRFARLCGAGLPLSAAFTSSALPGSFYATYSLWPFPFPPSHFPLMDFPQNEHSFNITFNF